MMKMPNVTFAAVAAAWFGMAHCGEPVKWRGIFINDEDWSLRPWAMRHFGEDEQIGTNTYAMVYDMMKRDGLNLIWPAMHEGGYEFSSRPENIAQAMEAGIWVGTSHCEPMLRNNCYLSESDKKKWDWTANKDFITAYWREATEKFATNNVMWTIGIRGIHDGRMRGGKDNAERIAILEDVFATQLKLLREFGVPSSPFAVDDVCTNKLQTANSKLQTPMVFCPYKEVLPIYNAGLKVPEDATILWVNDNYGYVRRIGGPQCEGRRQGIYYHIAYWYYPQCITTPPAQIWYELVAKCANNGVRDLWMLNVGDVFNAEILMYCYGKFASDPDWWMTRPDPQAEVLGMWVGDELGVRRGELEARIVSHLNEYYNLGFIRKPEHMCKEWAAKLPPSVKADLLRRYHALLAEDLAIEKEISSLRASASLREIYFRAIGFQAQFLARAGIIFLEGKDREYAEGHLDALNRRYDTIEGGKWAGFAVDTVRDPAPPKRDRSLACMHMQWPWNDGKNMRNDSRRGKRNPTSYRADMTEPLWLKQATATPSKGGEWKRVPGLGTSGNALALLPVKPGIGEGATLNYELRTTSDECAVDNSSFVIRSSSFLVIRFLPDFALWPGLKLRVKVQFDEGEAQIVEVPLSDGNISEAVAERLVLTQDNFVDVHLPIPADAKSVRIIALDPGIVIDKVGVSRTARPSDTL